MLAEVDLLSQNRPSWLRAVDALGVLVPLATGEDAIIAQLEWSKLVAAPNVSGETFEIFSIHAASLSTVRTWRNGSPRSRLEDEWKAANGTEHAPGKVNTDWAR